MTVALVVLIAIGLLGGFTAFEERRIEARYPPDGKRVAIEGGAIHVMDKPADGDGRPAVLLIHGASGNAADPFAALADPLAAKGMRALSFDRPGHGWSDRIGGPAASSPSVQAAALRRAAEALGISSAVVAAHSLGALTALALALEHPGFVRGLVLIAPVSHSWPGGVAWYYTLGAHPTFGAPFRRLVTLPAGLLWMRAAVAGVFAPNAPPANFIEATRLPLVLRPMHFRANCEDVADAEAAVAALSPRLRLDPSADRGRDRRQRRRRLRPSPRGGPQARHSGARLTTLRSVGHSPHHAAPTRIAEIILEAERRAAEREAATT